MGDTVRVAGLPIRTHWCQFAVALSDTGNHNRHFTSLMGSIKLLNGDFFDPVSGVLNGSHVSCRVLGNTRVHGCMMF
jgi:hypothetical protein